MRSNTLLRHWMRYLLLAGAIVCVLILYGAIPFVAMPTLGQAVMMMGFAESFAKESFLSVYSQYFGYPTPSPLVMGLPVAYPAGFLIRIGIHASDAYSTMAAVYLILAFFGGFLLCRMLGLDTVFSTLMSVLWLSIPVIWGHSGYSSLSFGLALIPFYMFLAWKLFISPSTSTRYKVAYYIIYICFCIVSVFMDGYSFMMFVVGASFLGVYVFIYIPEFRRQLALHAFPVHIVGFGIATLLYKTYVGSLFGADQLDLFRGWGLDLTFIIIPTKGVHLLWDILGLSIPRSSEQFFGDASVWITTFSFPLIIVGLLSWWRVKSKNRLAYAFIILSLLSFYLAMGPSIKINATKPEPTMGPLMPAELALAPTGNAFLYEHVPGFYNMRATYRWSALMCFSFWVLLAMQIGILRSQRSKLIMYFILMGLVISNMPHIQSQWAGYINNREGFYQIDIDLVTPLSHDLKEGELVAFLPYRNDFLVNYLAPKLKIRTYNVGQDKQLIIAREHWPDILRQFQKETVDNKFSDRVLLLLARNEADAVILPYIDMLWAAHFWPTPTKFKEEMAPVVAELLATGFVTVQERDYYAVVRIAPDFDDELKSGELEEMILGQSFSRPNESVNMRHESTAGVFLLSEWHDIESWSGVPTRWMQSDSSLVIFSPDNRTANLSLRALSFYRPRTLEIYSGEGLVESISVPSTGFIDVTTPIILFKGANNVRFHVLEGCERPCDIKELNNPDNRCLSIAEQNVTIGYS